MEKLIAVKANIIINVLPRFNARNLMDKFLTSRFLSFCQGFDNETRRNRTFQTVLKLTTVSFISSNYIVIKLLIALKEICRVN